MKAIVTVKGVVAAEDVGTCSIAEHLVARFHVPRPERATDAWFYERAVDIDLLGDLMLGRPNRDDAMLDTHLAGTELERFAAAGGRLAVELTTPDEGRDPLAIRQLSEHSGVHVVMSAVPSRGTDELVGELLGGAAGVRPGVIRLTRGSTPGVAWDASLATGAPVIIDADDDAPRLSALLRSAESAGMDPARLAVRAAPPLLGNPERLRAILGTGAYVAFDRLGRIPTIYTTVSDHEIATTISGLVAAGHGSQLLLGTGLDRKHAFTAFGGNGMRFVPAQFLPYLQMLGVPAEQANGLVTTNPARFLTWTEPAA